MATERTLHRLDDGIRGPIVASREWLGRVAPDELRGLDAALRLAKRVDPESAVSLEARRDAGILRMYLEYGDDVVPAGTADVAAWLEEQARG